MRYSNVKTCCHIVTHTCKAITKPLAKEIRIKTKQQETQ